MKIELHQNLNGNEVYYTACSLLVIQKNSCSQLHCQKEFNSIPFSYEIRCGGTIYGRGASVRVIRSRTRGTSAFCETLNARSEIRTPNPETRNPKSDTRNLKSDIRSTRPGTRNPKPEPRNLKPEARNPSMKRQVGVEGRGLGIEARG